MEIQENGNREKCLNAYIYNQIYIYLSVYLYLDALLFD